MSKDNSLLWVEISRSALAQNLQTFRTLVGKNVLLCPAVKSNAYGHGLIECGEIFREAGADYLAVNNVFEARKLREAGDTGPLYIMGYTSLDDLAEAVELNCELVVYDRETIERLGTRVKRRGTSARVHLKVETGTNRQGVLARELPEFLELIQKTPGVTLVGIAMHFANIEDTTNHDYARYQLEQFEKITRLIERSQEFPISNFQFPNKIQILNSKSEIKNRKSKIGNLSTRNSQLSNPLIRHAANSAAALLWSTTHFEMVRPGIAAYGMWPSEETFASLATERNLESDTASYRLRLIPALTWKTRIAQIKTIPAGACVGYGCTWKAPRETHLAILPVGYYDGYVRAYSEKASVIVNGKRAPVVGRVCMNIVMIDVTEIENVKLEDEVVLLGKSGDEEITAEEMGKWSGTINYEVTTRIREGIERKAV